MIGSILGSNMLIPSSRAVRKSRQVCERAGRTHTHSSLSAVGAFSTMTFSINMPLSYSSTRPEPAQTQARSPTPNEPRARKKKSWSKLAERNEAPRQRHGSALQQLGSLIRSFQSTQIIPKPVHGFKWTRPPEQPLPSPPLPTPNLTDRHKWNGALGRRWYTNIHQGRFFRWLRSVMLRDLRSPHPESHGSAQTEEQVSSPPTAVSPKPTSHSAWLECSLEAAISNRRRRREDIKHQTRTSNAAELVFH